MNITQCINYLEKHKGIVGLDQYTVLVADKFTDLDSYATIVPNIFEKTLKIELSVAFKQCAINAQKKILIHELIHGRLNVFDKEKEEMTSYIEEQYCNDLERGIGKLLDI